jgi:hypothetical protein
MLKTQNGAATELHPSRESSGTESPKSATDSVPVRPQKRRKPPLIKAQCRESDEWIFEEVSRRAKVARMTNPQWLLQTLELLFKDPAALVAPLLPPPPLPLPPPAPKRPAPASADELMWEYWSDEEKREKGYDP